MSDPSPQPGTATPPSVPGPFDAVVIGGSAGAFEVLMQLLAVLTPAVPPVIVVLHIPPTGPDLLSRTLDVHCALPVTPAEDKLPLRAGHVYVAPQDYHLLVEPDGRLALSLAPPLHFSRPAIDMLFSSAAHAYRERLLAVLLSGASADGAEGMAQVASLGGTILVQSPQSASASVMPERALARLATDRALDPAALVAWFANTWPEPPAGHGERR